MSIDGASYRERSQPETFRARSLTVSFTVNDIRKSVAWYRDVLGFIVAREYEREGVLRAVALKAGAVDILLTQDDGSKGLDRKKGEGFSVQFSTSQDIDQLAERFRSGGGTFVTEPSDAFGARMFRVRDPDGFLLVISNRE